MESFLTDRRTRISFNDYDSEWMLTNTEIPQRSTLSPVLFLFFIADLLETFESAKDDMIGLGFVDGTNLISWGLSVAENCTRLEKAPDKGAEWAGRFDAKFARDKDQIAHFKKKRGKQARISRLL